MALGPPTRAPGAAMAREHRRRHRVLSGRVVGMPARPRRARPVDAGPDAAPLTDAAGASSVTAVRRPALWTVVILGTLVVIGVFVQAYLISAAYLGAGADAIDAHGGVGGAVHGLEVLALVAALVAYWKRWALIVPALLLAVVGTVQIGLSEAESWTGGLHGLLAMFVLVLGAVVSMRALRELRGGTGANRAH